MSTTLILRQPNSLNFVSYNNYALAGMLQCDIQYSILKSRHTFKIYADLDIHNLG